MCAANAFGYKIASDIGSVFSLGKPVPPLGPPPAFPGSGSLGWECYMGHCQQVSLVSLSVFPATNRGWNDGRPAHCHPLRTREPVLLRRCALFPHLALCLKGVAPVHPFLEGVSVQLTSLEPPTVD